MLGSIVSRFRVAMLLMAFGLGVVGQTVVSSARTVPPMQAAMQLGVNISDLCPGCADSQHRGMLPGCTMTAACWTNPALPAQSSVVPPRAPAAFPEPVTTVIAGIRFGPDPHPPRGSLHS